MLPNVYRGAHDRVVRTGGPVPHSDEASWTSVSRTNVGGVTLTLLSLYLLT
jgi:hypothetical protein